MKASKLSYIFCQILYAREVSLSSKIRCNMIIEIKYQADFDIGAYWPKTAWGLMWSHWN